MWGIISYVILVADFINEFHKALRPKGALQIKDGGQMWKAGGCIFLNIHRRNKESEVSLFSCIYGQET